MSEPVNPFAGEVSLTVDGEAHVARLTLGALAELEETMGEASLMSLVQRFETGSFSSRDVLALLAAGLAGGGAVISAERLARAQIKGGPVAAARAAAELRARAFVVPE